MEINEEHLRYINDLVSDSPYKEGYAKAWLKDKMGEILSEIRRLQAKEKYSDFFDSKKGKEW
jgi:hypothetical protein